MPDYDENNPSWLSGQLTPEKQNAPMWAGLAHALQAVFDDHVTPFVERLAGLNSNFTMHPDDLALKIKELGSFFYFGGSVSDEDMPLSVMQKLDEVHFKRTDLPIKNAISREMGGMDIEWTPMYAPKVITPSGSIDYTLKVHPVSGELVSALVTKHEIGLFGYNSDDYFMTSRGVVSVKLSSLTKSGYNEDDLKILLERIIKPVVPLDIVFSGAKILIHYDILEPIERIFSNGTTLTEWFLPLLDRDRASSKGTVKQVSTANNAMSLPSGYLPRFDGERLDMSFLDN